MNEYSLNQKVFLNLAGAQNIPNGLKKYDQMIFRISNIRRLHNANRAVYWTYYELKECKSEKGVPYAIPEDWLHDAGWFKG